MFDESKEPSNGYTRVCSVAELGKNHAKCLIVDNRPLLLLHSSVSSGHDAPSSDVRRDQTIPLCLDMHATAPNLITLTPPPPPASPSQSPSPSSPSSILPLSSSSPAPASASVPVSPPSSSSPASASAWASSSAPVPAPLFSSSSSSLTFSNLAFSPSLLLSSSPSSAPPLRVQASYFAIDAFCYHAGAPLVDGDIEDIAGYGNTIVCPWHKYRIVLSTGEGLYQDLSRTWKSKGVRQRTHDVIVWNDSLYVKLSMSSGSASSAASDDLPSDQYCNDNMIKAYMPRCDDKATFSMREVK